MLPDRWIVGGERLIELERTVLMGILNVTPDSFSDGGAFLDTGRAVARAEEMASQGASIIDVGGESTRPGATEVDRDEEIRRVISVIREISSRMNVPVSVDTTKAAVAEAALDAGAVIVNDISGLSADPEMAGVVARSKAGLVLMHMRGTPRTMQSRTEYRDLMGEIVAELSEATARATGAGVELERIVVDPGLGFAKTPEQNLLILNRLNVVRTLGRPIMVGPSRKSFIAAITGAEVQDRLAGTLAAVVSAVLLGARLVRVHDVKEVGQAVALADAIRMASECSDRN